ncbi:hypothetical protein TTHT_0296 [Thermotomaculum hydrothermale]|uniref:Uncharacterized protein n=1 Tax=Thermotomaculum hydrothermale TaxID=981385 RepID=A0A7R6PSP3_9BACT|nr:hypothetical protein [Thermotomaculum hydrothermale]BBB31917.1 hypothetical protein TTHT_0296 [Thermotomaculum hydrothermale]
MAFKNITFKVMVLVFILFCMRATANTFYLPHIHASSDAWETYLIVDPVLYGNAYYELTLYDDNGNVVTTQTGTIPKNQELRLSLRQFGGTSGIFKTKAYPVRVRLGYIAKDDLGGGTAEFSLPESLSMQAVMTLSNYYDKLNWSGFALFNGSDHDITVTAEGYKDGTQVVSKSFDMNAHTKVVDFFDNFFGLNSFGDIDSVIFYTDFPALTGIVISGMDNDKLLFSPSMNSVPNQSISNEEYFEGFTYQRGIVYVNYNYYTFVYNNSKYYLRKIYSDSDSKFAMYELSTNVFAYDIFPSSDGENIILAGTGDNGKYVVAKVSPEGDTIWQTAVGDYNTSWLAETDENNIVGRAYNGSVIVAFHDHSTDSGTIVTLNDNNGSQTAINNNFMSSGRFYKAFVYNGKIGFAWKYIYLSKYRLQFIFINPDGSEEKKIFADSPLNPDTDNVFFDAFGNGDYIYSVIGVKISDGTSVVGSSYYSLFTLVFPYSNSDFSNANILPIYGTFLPLGSCVYSGFTYTFSSSYSASWMIFTSPYYSGMTSQGIIMGLDSNNLPSGIYTYTYMPYKMTGAIDLWGMFLITGLQEEKIDSATSRTKLIEKTLIGNNLLSY